MNASLTDEELIRLYYPSQPRYCVDILYKRYYQMILHQCLKLTRHPKQAQNFFQNIFLNLGSFQQRPQLLPGGPGGFIQLRATIAGISYDEVNSCPPTGLRRRSTGRFR